MGLAQNDDEDEDTPASQDDQEGDDGATSDIDKQQAIKDYLAKQYGQAADSSGVKNAIDASHSTNTIANIGDALETMVRARSTALGGPGADTAFYQGLKQQGQAGVQQAQADRSAKIQDFLQKNQLGRQATEDNMKAEDFGQKKKGWEVTNDANDPNSKQSQVARRVWEAANPSMKLAEIPGWAPDENGEGGMSAADMALVKDPIDLKARLDERALAAKQHADWMNASIAQKAGAVTAKTDAAGDKATAKKTADQEKTAAKATSEQTKNYKEMFNRGEGGRGAPQSFTKAQVAQTSVKNAQELLNNLPKGPDGQPDYNKMSPTQVHLFNGELEKLATNGSPTEGGRAAQDAGTFAQKWAQFKNKFAGPDGEVSGADLGPFIKQSAAYIAGLGKVSDEVVNSYRRSNFDNYAKPGLISPEHQAIYKGQHPELFPEEQDQGATAPAPAPAGDKQAAAPPAPTHPEADAALAWAKAHPKDPRAAEILKRLGSNNAGL